MQGLPRLNCSHALFLDFDGTLADIAPQPDAVRLAPDTRAVLAHLDQYLQGALAIVTGRTLSDIDHFLAPTQLTVASEHGAQLRQRPDTSNTAITATTIAPASGIAPDLHDATLRIQQFLQRYPSLLLETKVASLALHYRNATSLEPICLALMQEIVQSMPQMELLRGKCVVELKPKGPSKGQAVHTLMQQAPFQGRTPVFAGDDLSDESAFSAVQAWGGVGIKIGPGNSCAMLRCESPAQVRTWLCEQAVLMGGKG